MCSRSPFIARFLICGLLFLALPALAAERSRIFYPHLTAPAATVGPGGIAFQSFPGANGLQGFFYNALDLGVGNRLEFGTAPLFWFAESHRYNFNAKWNVFKSRNFHFALGVSKFAFNAITTMPDGSVASVESFELLYGLLAVNFFLSDAVALGVNVAKPSLTSSSPELANALGQNQKIEWFVDMAFQLGKRLAFTPGYGALRLDTLDPRSLIPVGYGATFTWSRHVGLMGRISFGAHHMPSIRETRAIFSFSIW